MRTHTVISNLRRRHDRTDPEAGIGLVEALVASLVMIMAVLAGSQILITGFRVAADARAKDQATVITNETLERARAFGCGLNVGVEPVNVVTDRKDKCFTSAGPAQFTTTVNGITYTTEITYHWRILNPSRAPQPTCQTRNFGETPDALERRVKTTWTTRGVARSIDESFIESIPPNSLDFNSPERATIVIKTTPGNLVELNTNSAAANNLRRHADSDGCAWFPFLTPRASYQFKIGPDSNRDGQFDSTPTVYSTPGPHQRQTVCTYTVTGSGFNGCRPFAT